jgi:hypothetical protein
MDIPVRNCCRDKVNLQQRACDTVVVQFLRFGIAPWLQPTQHNKKSKPFSRFCSLQPEHLQQQSISLLSPLSKQFDSSFDAQLNDRVSFARLRLCRSRLLLGSFSKHTANRPFTKCTWFCWTFATSKVRKLHLKVRKLDNWSSKNST